MHCAFIGPPSRLLCVSIDRGGGVGVLHYADDHAAGGGGGGAGAMKEETMMPLALEPVSSGPLRLCETDADALVSAPAAVARLALESATRATVWLPPPAAAPPVGTSQAKRAPKLKALAKALFTVSAGHWDGGVRLSCIDAASSAVRMQLSLVAPLDSRTTVCCATAATPTRAPIATPARAPTMTTTFVVAGTECGAVIAWEFRGHALVLPPRVCVGHSGAVTALAASAPIDLVISGSVDGTILLHALRSGDLVRRIRLAYEDGAVPSPPAALRALAFVLGGRIAALTSDALLLFDLNDGTVLARRAVSGGAAAGDSGNTTAGNAAVAESDEESEEGDGDEEEMLPQLVATVSFI